MCVRKICKITRKRNWKPKNCTLFLTSFSFILLHVNFFIRVRGVFDVVIYFAILHEWIYIFINATKNLWNIRFVLKKVASRQHEDEKKVWMKKHPLLWVRREKRDAHKIGIKKYVWNVILSVYMCPRRCGAVFVVDIFFSPLTHSVASFVRCHSYGPNITNNKNRFFKFRLYCAIWRREKNSSLFLCMTLHDPILVFVCSICTATVFAASSKSICV